MTAPPVRLMHLSDIHFGHEDANALTATAAYAESNTPDAILVAGDITQQGRREEFAAARKWFDGFETPVITAPGNHDTPIIHLAARVADPFGRYERSAFGRTA